MEYYLACKRKEILIRAITWMNLDINLDYNIMNRTLC